jgi:hypothetical protein
LQQDDGLNGEGQYRSLLASCSIRLSVNFLDRRTTPCKTVYWSNLPLLDAQSLGIFVGHLPITGRMA